MMDNQKDFEDVATGKEASSYFLSAFYAILFTGVSALIIAAIGNGLGSQEPYIIGAAFMGIGISFCFSRGKSESTLWRFILLFTLSIGGAYAAVIMGYTWWFNDNMEVLFGYGWVLRLGYRPDVSFSTVSQFFWSFGSIEMWLVFTGSALFSIIGGWKKTNSNHTLAEHFKQLNKIGKKDEPVEEDGEPVVLGESNSDLLPWNQKK